MDRYFSIEEVAKMMRVEYKTVYRLVRSGELPAGRIGRCYRVSESDLERFFQDSKTHAIKGRERELVPLAGLTCCVTGKRIVSEGDVGGYASDTGHPSGKRGSGVFSRRDSDSS